uniref:Secreted protein n=1 Tax=Triticum urartu TaxID=4572 RepID=A0A8R7V8D7_TRIUA
MVMVVAAAPARRVGGVASELRAHLAALLVHLLLLFVDGARACCRRRCELYLDCPASGRLGEERGPVVAGHDDHDVLLEIQGRLGRAGRRGLLPVAPRLLAVPVAVEVPGELPVGARQDEQRQGDEPQHRRQAAEQVRHRRLPWRVRRRPVDQPVRRRHHRRPRAVAHGDELGSGPH